LPPALPDRVQLLAKLNYCMRFAKQPADC